MDPERIFTVKARLTWFDFAGKPENARQSLVQHAFLPELTQSFGTACETVQIIAMPPFTWMVWPVT